MLELAENIPDVQVFDSRAIIAEIERLEADDSDDSPLDADELELRDMLREFADTWRDQIADWGYGATFIREDYFTEYAEQLAADLGAIGQHTGQWPLCHIDWEAAADALKVDYTTVELDGSTYFVR